MLVTQDNFYDAISSIFDAPLVTVDLETTSLDPYNGGEICGIAIEIGMQSYYFPFRHGEGENLDPRQMDALRVALSLPFKTLLFWNGKFDIKYLLHEGFAMPTRIEDGMLAAHLMNENERSFGLKNLARKYVDPTAADESEELLEALRLAGYTKRRGSIHIGDKGQMWKLPASMVSAYAEDDVIYTRRLRDFYANRLAKEGIYRLWVEENVYELVVMDIERHGMLLDTKRTRKAIHESIDGKKESELALAKIAGYVVNPNSPKQVCSLLGIPSSAVEVLDGLDHPAVEHIIRYRRHSKMQGAYYQAFLNSIDPNGVIHPNLSMTGTDTGRLSCSDPNLQAIPRGSKNDPTDPRNGIKNVFIARPGKLLIVADYKQAEIFLGSHYANATAMLDMIYSGVNVHQASAERIGIDYDAAKRLNFSMMYGIGAKALAGDLKCSVRQAQLYLDEYNKVHPEMKKLYKVCMAAAERDGYIQMFTGRMRRYDHALHVYETTASSNLIQGGVAEMMRIAATNVWLNLRHEGVDQMLHVHDSIIAEIPDDKPWLIDAIAETMTSIPPPPSGDWKVRFQVDVSVGRRWSEVQPYKLITQ